MINVAVAGYGYWGPNLVRNIQDTGEACVVACCDASQDRLKQVSAKYPSVTTTTRYEDLLKNPAIDAIAIATPVATHYQFARKALENGKHVLLEKPATSSTAEAEKLVDLAEKHKLTFMVDHTFIYTGAVRKMKEVVEQGDLGELYYLDSVRINLGLFQRDVNVLWDLAPHDIAILEHLVKEKPVSVCATGACHVGNGHENVAYLTVYYDSGLIAHFHNNWLSPVKVRTMLVGGSKKTIHYDDMEVSEKIKIYDRGVDIVSSEGVHEARVSYRLGDMWAPRLDPTEALRLMAAEFADCIRTGRRSITDGISGLNVVRILEASEMSIKHRGKEIRL
ncbi:Gfo/Idh/MocA family protein [Geobacter sp. SVR]|uniref:Gfo/Idh/MocA family protein n=1 Tax=Geobacter sp. SVR TaxID=2495594 RepID=UPI00143EF7BC|nr:Gfo/Idh/MocA family oxidoreductase [Geobacter sp. SVR]BCS54979.1 oxidoreductase [Geobacter sp. SVR]GCF85161.1 oxidoreductase [Geobacter sp. SVR]